LQDQVQNMLSVFLEDFELSLAKQRPKVS
jgi:hypothetical protein